MATFKAFNFIASLHAWRDRDVTSNGGLVIHLQFGRFSPARRRYFVLRHGKFVSHRGSLPSTMDHKFAKTQFPKRAVHG